MITARCLDCGRTVYLGDGDPLTCPVCSAALVREEIADESDAFSEPLDPAAPTIR